MASEHMGSGLYGWRRSRSPASGDGLTPTESKPEGSGGGGLPVAFQAFPVDWPGSNLAELTTDRTTSRGAIGH